MEGTRDLYEMYKRWGSYSDSPIYWLTTPTHAQLQLIYVVVSFQPHRSKGFFFFCTLTLPC